MDNANENSLFLYATLLGGNPTRSSGCPKLEQHDIIFLVGPEFKKEKDFIRYFWPKIRRYWPEAHRTLHIDSYQILTNIDGFSVKIVKEGEKTHDNQGNNVFFLDLGGYQLGKLFEIHEPVFVIAKSKAEAKAKIKETHAFFKQGIQFSEKTGKTGPRPHVDFTHSLTESGIHQTINIGKVLASQGYKIILIKSEPQSENPNPITYLGFGKLNM